jgi:curved DNA-binding protein CbpA
MDKSEARTILGVGANASQEEIKQSYRILIKSYHPDKNPHLTNKEKTTFSQKYQRIQEAYETLRVIKQSNQQKNQDTYYKSRGETYDEFKERKSKERQEQQERAKRDREEQNRQDRESKEKQDRESKEKQDRESKEKQDRESKEKQDRESKEKQDRERKKREEAIRILKEEKIRKRKTQMQTVLFIIAILSIIIIFIL